MNASVHEARSALIVVDVQNGFLPGGTLPVPDGDRVVPVINRLAPAFRNIVITQDWHPAGHISFASSHAGRQAFETVDVPYGPQVLWPDHCLQGSADAALCADLRLPTAQLVIRKGYRREIDSYSAFEEADHRTGTGLTGYLRERGIDTVFIVGLATDYCVAWTALDARRFGFAATVIEDATRGIDIQGSVGAAWARMLACGVRRVASERLDAG